MNIKITSKESTMLSIGEMEGLAHMLADQFQLQDKWGRQISQQKQNGHKVFRDLVCPCCNKRKCGIYAPERRDNYLVGCFSPTCTLSRPVTLSTAIKKWGDDYVKKEWDKKTGWIDYKTAYNFKPIKNRIPRGKSKKTKEDTFRSQMESKSIRQEVRSKLEIQKMEEEKFKTFQHPRPKTAEEKKQEVIDEWFDDLMSYFNVKSVEKLPKLIKTHGLPSLEELKRKKD